MFNGFYARFHCQSIDQSSIQTSFSLMRNERMSTTTVKNMEPILIDRAKPNKKEKMDKHIVHK